VGVRTGHRRIARTLVALIVVAAAAGAMRAQERQVSAPTDLPNPYRLVDHWATLPASMNGGQWGEVIRVHVAANGNVWVFHRCFNVIPAGSATCIGRGPENPPILEFNAAGRLLKSFGAGLFAYPHGFTVDGDGNLWTTDVNDQGPTLLGQQVLKLSPDGKVLMALGKAGVAATGADGFDRPTSVAVAPDGQIFVADGHAPNKFGTGRIVKFSKDGRYLTSWGRKGSAPGEFDEPHDLFIGGSRGRVYVADRRNNRIQVFDQNGGVIAVWTQFGQPSSVFVGKDDTIYVGASFKSASAKKGEVRGIVVGNAITGTLTAFIPDPTDLDTVITGTSASGIAADSTGAVFAADVGAHKLRKYVKVP
jgi:hypothetical protein